MAFTGLCSQATHACLRHAQSPLQADASPEASTSGRATAPRSHPSGSIRWPLRHAGIQRRARALPRVGACARAVRPLGRGDAEDVSRCYARRGTGDGWVLAHSLRDGLAQAIEPAALEDACGGRASSSRPTTATRSWPRRSTGGPAGLLREHEAWQRWEAAPPPPEIELDAAIRAGVREAQRRGVTGVHDFQRSGGLAAWQRLAADGALAFRVWASLPAERLDEALELGLRSGLGDEWLRIGPIKAFADGTLGSRTASMLEPYTRRRQGLRLIEPDELRDLVARASRGGLDVAVHAIGDRAKRDVLDALEATREIWEPAGCDRGSSTRSWWTPTTSTGSPSSASRPRCSRPTARPISPRRCAPGAPSACRRLRLRRTARGRRSAVLRLGRADRGARPLAGVRSAVEGGLPVEAALDGFWSGAARARHAERTLGRLVPGAAADLVVLDRDPTSCPVEELDRIEVVATMVGGRWVHGAPHGEDRRYARAAGDRARTAARARRGLGQHVSPPADGAGAARGRGRRLGARDDAVRPRRRGAARARPGRS